MRLLNVSLNGVSFRQFATAIAAIWLSCAPPASAINIEIDYRYDTNGYFDVPARKAAMEAAASFFEEILTDNLLSINPAEFSRASWTVNVRNPQTGSTVNLVDPVVPEDTIIVFAGARELGGTTRGQGGNAGWSGSGFSSWFERIRTRGSAGATASPATDYSPHFGFVSFDITTSFNFSTTQNLSGTDFVSVALHELGHVLGIGISNAWDDLISGSVFTGPASVRAAGGNPGIDSGGGHFNQSVSNKPAFGSFGVSHGTSIPVLMRPSLTSTNGLLTVIGDLDLAALVDIGWEVSPPINWSTNTLSPASAQFSWPSSSFLNYTVERSTDLDFSSNVAEVDFNGDGTSQSWTDSNPPSGRAFYRLRSEPRDSVSLARQSAVTDGNEPPEEVYEQQSEEPRWVDCSECGHH